MKLAPLLTGVALATIAAGAAAAAPRFTAPAQDVGMTAPPDQDLSGVPVADRGDVITWRLVTNGPVPDTPANRAQYEPLSHAGRLTAPTGD